MSEEKLYAVKNDEGKSWNFLDSSDSGFWALDSSDCFTTTSKDDAELVADERGGHVVTLIEEPEKVAVSPNEAQAIKSLLNANTYADVYDPFKYLFTSRYKKDIKRLTEAIKNGYTVKKNQYRVIAPKSWWYDDDAPLYLFFDFNDGMRFTVKKDNPSTLFTKEQLSAFGLDGEYFQKEEATDDGE